MFSSPEEIQHLRLLMKKDLAFETTSSWPNLVEWCSRFTSTRTVKLVLPQEEVELPEEEEEMTMTDYKVGEENQCCEATAKDAFTQTLKQKPRRRGGRGSRTRRMLAFQLMLTFKHSVSSKSSLAAALGYAVRTIRLPYSDVQLCMAMMFGDDGDRNEE